MAWRYDRGATGDTSILGWVVMALKSAKVVGIPGPDTSDGILAGSRRSPAATSGLASTSRGDKVTPTMTAEAWVCRQFLGVGGPGPASTEAADYLLENGPTAAPTTSTTGITAHSPCTSTAATPGPAGTPTSATRSSAASAKGHMAGSWDPDDSLYGAKGGRIYCTALATLTLEVYYRFLRLYDDPKLPGPTTTNTAAWQTPQPRPSARALEGRPERCHSSARFRFVLDVM